MSGPLLRPNTPLLPLIEEHASEVFFLWMLRDRAAVASTYVPEELARLDTRLDAHLWGLKVAGDAGVAMVSESPFDEAGHFFAAIQLDLHRGAAVDEFLGPAAEGPGLWRGVVSALGWASWQTLEPWLRQVSTSLEAPLQRASLEAYRVHRRDPGALLVRSLETVNPEVREAALRAATVLGRKDLLPRMRESLSSAEPRCRFAAAYGVTLLEGGPREIDELRTLVMGGVHSGDAYELLARRMPVAQARAWHAELARNPDNSRLACRVAEAVGDSAMVDWLIATQHAPAMARVAGASFASVMGVRLEEVGLDANAPESEDDAQEHEEDLGLPWPDVPRVEHFWLNRKIEMQPRERYLGGARLESDLSSVLQVGTQRVRRSVALELFCRGKTVVLTEVRAATVPSGARATRHPKEGARWR